MEAGSKALGEICLALRAYVFVTSSVIFILFYFTSNKRKDR